MGMRDFAVQITAGVDAALTEISGAAPLVIYDSAIGDNSNA